MVRVRRLGLISIIATVAMLGLMVPAQASSPSNVYIFCSKAYAFADSNGTYNIQHACQTTTAPWGFRIAPSLCAIATSYVTESGMRWTRNGVTQPTQAPHVVACSYVFHGTYNPGRGDDHISYGDGFTFAVKGGTASLSIHGNFILTDTPANIHRSAVPARQADASYIGVVRTHRL